MPEGIEYLHCVQAALDAEGFRCQVLDMDGVPRERLEWPFRLTDGTQGQALPSGAMEARFSGRLQSGEVAEFRLRGQTPDADVAPAQTIFSAFSPGAIAVLWLGLRGPHQTLTLILARDPGRSPSYWFGPNLPAGQNVDIHVAFYPDMGPGGVLYRLHDDSRWSSFKAAAATGLERLAWPSRWSVGQGQGGPDDRPYRGSTLSVEMSNLPESQKS
jgi:hypothetical protein